jgi:non-specific protein-tyrosine kinase
VALFWKRAKTAKQDQAADLEAVPEMRAGEPPQTVERERAGWISPSYTQSRAAWLNPLTAAANRCVGVLPASPYMGPYKVLRTQILQKTQEQGGRAIMVTSPLSGEGKTTTAINLSFAFAREFRQTVLLVDCDFRKQRIHELLGIKSDKGLIDHLFNNQPISDLIIWPGFEKLTLISGGGTVPDSTELLASPKMKELVEDMKNRYPERYVFFDVPGVLTGADALAFAPQMDYILMVVSAGATPLADVRSALQLLPSEKVIGLVLNKYQKR